MPLVLALRRHRQMDPSGSSEVEFKASLAYRESSKTTRAVIQRNTQRWGESAYYSCRKPKSGSQYTCTHIIGIKTETNKTPPQNNCNLRLTDKEKNA